MQLRLADHKFEQAEAFEAIQAEHVCFIEIFTTTPHWAPQDRNDGLRTPQAILAGARGRRLFPDALRQLLREVQFERSIDQHGYMSIQRFYIYAERGLARGRVSI